jgi:putative redox protein
VQRDASTVVSALEAELVDDQAVGQSSGAAPAMRQALFVLPSRWGDGFRVSIRGHLLELADPSPGHGLAPTPDDLLIASIASDLAWAARRFLRAHGVHEDVSVAAAWRTPESPSRLADIRVTVSVPDSAETESDALMAALEERVAARSLDEPLHFDLRFRR